MMEGMLGGFPPTSFHEGSSTGSSSSHSSGSVSPLGGTHLVAYTEDFSTFSFGEDDAEDTSSMDEGPSGSGGKESTCLNMKRGENKSTLEVRNYSNTELHLVFACLPYT